MTNPTSASDLIQQGIALYKGGDKFHAGRLFYQATQTDPTSQVAWLWLAGCVDEEKDKQTCLEKVIAINAENEAGKQARVALERLKPTQTPEEMPTLEQIVTKSPTSEQPAATTESVPQKSSREVSKQQLIERFIALKSQEGWQIVYRTETSIQMKKPKQFHSAGCILFVVLPALAALLIFPPLMVIAVLGLIIVTADYVLKKDELIFWKWTEDEQPPQ